MKPTFIAENHWSKVIPDNPGWHQWTCEPYKQNFIDTSSLAICFLDHFGLHEETAAVGPIYTWDTP